MAAPSVILDVVTTSAPVADAPASAPGSRPPLKIGIVSPYGYPHPGGVNEHVRFTHDAMRRMGHDVWIITSKYGRERESEGRVIRLGTGWAAPANGSVGRVTLGLRFKKQVREVLAQHRFDILHFHEPLVPFLSPTMLDASETVNVGTFHAFGGFSPSYWIGSKFARRLADKLDGRIAVSGAARHFINRYFPGDYRIIPNGIDVEAFEEPRPPLPELHDGKINLLFVGRLDKRKGLVYLLNALPHVKYHFPNLRLIVIGAFDEDQMQEYRYFVQETGLTDVVFKGFVSFEDKIRYYQSCDLFCSPAIGRESQGIILLEAMAAGKPVIASAIDGYRTVVDHEQDGLLVRPADPTALAVGICRLLSDTALRDRLAAAGRAKAQSYSWPKVARQILDLYEETIERAKSEEIDRPSEDDGRHRQSGSLLLPYGLAPIQL